MVVITATDRNKDKLLSGNEQLFYLNNEFPIEEMQYLINEGDYYARPATTQEKEVCFWVYDKLDKTSFDLSDIDFWRRQMEASNKKQSSKDAD